MRAEISGSDGSAFLQARWHEAQGYMIEIDGEEKVFELPTIGKGYSYEITEVQKCLREGKLQSEKWSWQNSLDLANLLDEVRNINGITFPFED